MITILKITIIVDNISSDPGLLSEHGLSLWIEADTRRILFDTGQSEILIHNAQKLGIDLSTADTLILSHGHYDHTGGVAALLRFNPAFTVYAHPGIFVTRFSKQSDGSMKPVGIPAESLSALTGVSDQIRWINKPKLLSDDIWITGPVPRNNTFEDTGGAFYFDTEAKAVDPIADDLSIWFRTVKGLCVVTGCCHSGIVNTLSYIQSIEKNAQIDTIIGGMHLRDAPSLRMEKTCEYLQAISVNKIVPCHCSGEHAIMHLTKRFNQKIIPGMTGQVLTTP